MFRLGSQCVLYRVAVTKPSCLLEAGRYGDLIELLACARMKWWYWHRFGAEALARQGAWGCRDRLRRWMPRAGGSTYLLNLLVDQTGMGGPSVPIS